MSRETLLMVEALAGEKNVSEEVVFGALEFALAGAVRKQFEDEQVDVRVHIDRETGERVAYRRWKIVKDEDYTYPSFEKTIEEMDEDYGLTMAEGDIYEEVIETAEFGRISAQTAKQVILQRIRDAEREQVIEEFLQRQEKLITGTVKRTEKNGAYIEVGKLDAFLPREQMIARENLRSGDRIRAYMLRVDRRGTRPMVILSRTAKEFLIELFSLEVPEIEDGTLEIKAVARIPGMRAKIAVKSSDSRIDPQGTCIGVKGTRVNAVSNAVAGENIDVVLWSPDTVEFVINALSPASVKSIMVDEDLHTVEVVVEEDQLAQAIGRSGQNVRLAAELTGWNINIMTVKEAEEKRDSLDAPLREMFMTQLKVDENIADILVQEGFCSLEEVAYVPLEEMQEIEEFNDDVIEALRVRAREALEEQAAIDEERICNAEDNLKNTEGVDRQMLLDLLNAGISTQEDLAELSIDELVEITGVEDEVAKQVILASRKHWFEEEEK